MRTNSSRVEEPTFRQATLADGDTGSGITSPPVRDFAGARDLADDRGYGAQEPFPRGTEGPAPAPPAALRTLRAALLVPLLGWLPSVTAPGGGGGGGGASGAAAAAASGLLLVSAGTSTSPGDSGGSDDSLSAGAIAGIAVGGVACIGLLVALAACGSRRLRRRQTVGAAPAV